MKAEVNLITNTLVIKRGPGSGTYDYQTFDGYETSRDFPDKGAEIQIVKVWNSDEVKFHFGYYTDHKEFKRDILLSRDQVKEVIKHLINLI